MESQSQAHAAMFSKPPAPTAFPTPSDGATIEVGRRRRGRPPGSKNKPKTALLPAAVSSTSLSEPPMSPYILEIPSGNDIVDAVSRFSRRKAFGICVLSASGSVSDVTLRHPSTPAGPASSLIVFRGRFEILSISATFLSYSSSKATPFYSFPTAFSISLAGPQGQIVGGFVAGPLVAAGTVFIVAASFTNPSYHRLPADEETRSPAAAKGSGGEAVQGQMGGEGGDTRGGMAVYGLGGVGGRHDLIWAPSPTSTRAPHPPPY